MGGVEVERALALDVGGWVLPTRVERIERDRQNGHATFRTWLPPVDPLRGDEGVRGSKPGTISGALKRFMALASAPPVKIEHFIYTHGPLNCRLEDGAPSGHFFTGVPIEESDYWYREYAALAQAVVRTAQRAEQGQTIAAADVEVFHRHWMRWAPRHGFAGPDLSKEGGPALPRALAQDLAAIQQWVPPLEGDLLDSAARFGFDAPDYFAPRVVMEAVNWWFTVGDVRPYLWYTRDVGPTLRWGGGLWGALGVQLAGIVVRKDPPSVCRDCQKPIRARKLQRRARTGARCTTCQRRYDAQRKAEWRAAQRGQPTD